MGFIFEKISGRVTFDLLNDDGKHVSSIPASLMNYENRKGWGYGVTAMGSIEHENMNVVGNKA
jgi:hypothetical protein